MWVDQRSIRLQQAFLSECKRPMLDEKLRYFVAQFGKHGTVADLDWILAAPELILYEDVPGSAYMSNVSGKASDLLRGIWYCQSVISEAEVERFAREPELLHRYYIALFWIGFLDPVFSTDDHSIGRYIHFQVILPEFKHVPDSLRNNAPDAMFWGYARSFFILAHATGRDDLLKSSDRATIISNENKWLDWMTGDGYSQLSPSTDKLTWRVVPGFDNGRQLDPLGASPTSPFPDLAEGRPRRVTSPLHGPGGDVLWQVMRDIGSGLPYSGATRP
jgi:hypothetical protein